MKQLHVLIFAVIANSSFKSIAQDCETLNNFNSFHGIRFEYKIPDSLKSAFKEEVKYDSNPYKSYYLEYDAIVGNKDLSNKFQKWFVFGDEIFTKIYITCLLDDRVYQIMLMNIYSSKDLFNNIDDSIEIVKKRLPPMFLNANRQLKSLFGDPTRTNQDSDLFANYYENFWECEKQNIELRLIYHNNITGANPTGLLLITDLIFTNNKLAKIEKLDELQK